MYVEAPHIIEWVSEHSAKVVGPDAATELIAALDELPWVGASLDKPAIGGVMIKDKEFGDPDVLRRVRATRLGRHTHAYVMYAPGEPGLIASVPAVITDLDLVLSQAPGYRYLCGASEDGRFHRRIWPSPRTLFASGYGPEDADCSVKCICRPGGRAWSHERCVPGYRHARS